MRILVDSHTIGQNEGGIERYIKNVLISLEKIVPIGAVLYKKPTFPLKKSTKTYYVYPNDFFRLFIIPFILIFQGYDTYFSNYTTPFFKPRGKKYIITLHDVSYIPQKKLFSLRDRLLFLTILPYSLALADIIIVPSNFVRREASKWYPQHAHKIRVVYEGVDTDILACKEIPKDRPPRMIINIQGLYFLCINSKNQRKNIDLIVQAFHRLTNKHIKLIIVGGRRNITSRIIDKRIRILPYVNDHALAYLYKNAHALIYYSSYEGFGLPVIESIANSTPVIASDIPSLREIAKKYITFVPLNNLAALSEILRITASKTKEKMVVDLNHFPYSWKRTAKKIVEIVDTV